MANSPKPALMVAETDLPPLINVITNASMDLRGRPDDAEPVTQAIDNPAGRSSTAS